VPHERNETIRQEIISLLENQTLTARDLSPLVRISVKEAYEHLSHIQKTANKTEYHLTVIPAECIKCGFVFRKREKLKKPGKCPVCRNEQIKEPLFSIVNQNKAGKKTTINPKNALKKQYPITKFQ
jgi:predicted Zn-ribbon and HTH transcriptional regulator